MCFSLEDTLLYVISIDALLSSSRYEAARKELGKKMKTLSSDEV